VADPEGISSGAIQVDSGTDNRLICFPKFFTLVIEFSKIVDSCGKATVRGVMGKLHRIRSAVGVLVLAGLSYVPAHAAGYDVSYLWHGQLPSVEIYRDKVAAVLGPAVAKDLRIVQKPGLYGLIYQRNGSSAGASKVASVHSRLLRSRGLDAAAPMRSGGWNVVGEGPVRQASASEPTKTAEVAKPAAEVAKPVAEVAKPVAAVEPAPPQPAQRSHISEIELAVENYIKGLRAKGVIEPDERTAWSVYDFTTGEKLVQINENVQFQAASMVKPFFALAFFHKMKHEQLNYGPQTQTHMRRMIQNSNNYSTNWILRRVGGPAEVQSILTKHYPGIFSDVHIVEYIPGGGKTYRNKASARDYSRFLYALWQNQIPGADEIKRLMALPAGNRLYTGANLIPKGTQVYNKTGSTARLCGDMGILVVKGRNGKSYPYTVIGVIEKGGRAHNYTTWIKSRGNVIRQVSNIVYEGISRHHNLRS
jgi:beta-lactamase class A